MGKLGALESCLSALSRVVKEDLPYVQSELLPIVYNHGLSSLPVDVLAQIFEMTDAEWEPGNAYYASEDSYYASGALAISHVNRRFRNVAFSLPKLWAELYIHNNPQPFLRRTKLHDISLDLNFDIGNGVEDTLAENLMYEAGLHSDRWRSLKLCGSSDYNNQPREVMKFLLEGFSGKTLPALETLCTNCRWNVLTDTQGSVLEADQDFSADGTCLYFALLRRLILSVIECGVPHSIQADP